MLDTIAIKLEPWDYKITHPNRFSPNPNAWRNSALSKSKPVKCHYNPSQKEKNQGYLPHLTLFGRNYPGGLATWLKIEFSAPKLIFGNNFQELSDADFNKVIVALRDALMRMGIETTQDALMEATVTAIHFSKNVILERNTPCFLLLQLLGKVDLNKRLDVSQSLFRNGGQMAKYHSCAYEIAIYDKNKDLEQAQKYGENRGVEKDYEHQSGLPKTGYKAQILRIEVRLKSKKLSNLLDKLGEQQDRTFSRLFHSDLSQKILLYYWKEITQGLYIMNIDVSSPASLICEIRKKFPRKRHTSILALVGLIITCQELGERGARLALNLSDSQYYSLKSDAKKLSENHMSFYFQSLNSVKKELERYAPITDLEVFLPIRA